jgi:hypothetical protein
MITGYQYKITQVSPQNQLDKFGLESLNIAGGSVELTKYRSHKAIPAKIRHQNLSYHQTADQWRSHAISVVTLTVLASLRVETVTRHH